MSGLFDLDLFEEDVELNDEEFETMLEATRYSLEFEKAWKKYQELYHSNDNIIKKLQSTIDAASSDAQRKKVADIIKKHEDDLKPKIDTEQKKLIKMYANALVSYKYAKNRTISVHEFFGSDNIDPDDYIPANRKASDMSKKDLVDLGFRHTKTEDFGQTVHNAKPSKYDATDDRKPGRYKMNESAEFAPDSNATNDVDNGETDAKISVPSKTELDSNTYNDALSKLKASFKESIDIISMLENVTINNDDAILESVICDAIYEASMNGAIYESVKKDDKDDIKAICDELTSPFKKYIKGLKLKYIEPKELTKIIIGLLTGAHIPNTHWWNNRLWQMVGLINCEEANIKNVIDKFNEEHSEELGEYKLIYTSTYSIRLWLATKFNWKSNYKTYLIIVDKKLPFEIKKGLEDLDKVAKKTETDELE